MTCDCKSYNLEIGSRPEVVLDLPWKDYYPGGEKKTTVCIDACIVPVIKHLWANNVVTLGSCCGHNKYKPSIILQESTENADHVRKIIKEIDDRDFDLLSWNLISV